MLATIVDIEITKIIIYFLTYFLEIQKDLLRCIPFYYSYNIYSYLYLF